MDYLEGLIKGRLKAEKSSGKKATKYEGISPHLKPKTRSGAFLSAVQS
jgi:hypothetical protein